MRLSVHREGVPIIAAAAAVAGLAWLLYAPLGWVLAVIALWSLWFFRDPERTAPDIPGVILSPADGKLLPIVAASPPEELGMGDAALTRISIFMNIFDVHVNRNPADGVVTAMNYRAGKFLNASFDKASTENERLAVRLAMDTGQELAVVQIAGLVARRIRSELAVGDKVVAGRRFGIIRFGSRLDVYLPNGLEPRVQPGQRMVAGETVIAVAPAPSNEDPSS
jgi:phosphatidylserine decarboxylase